MSLPQIPSTLDEWDIDVLNELINYVGIESETFDFKEEANELEEHICAMANTRGGYLVLGIRQIDSEDGTTIIKFEKRGFQYGKQDNTRNQIGNAILNIESTPIVSIKHIEQEDKSKFYTVIKIENKISAKPYFVKNTDQCFVRINTSKIRANRSTILQLFSSTVEQIKNIKNLRASSALAKEELDKTVDWIRKIGPGFRSTAPPVDLSFLRNAILVNETFLVENDLLGTKTNNSFFFVLRTIGLLNTKINVFNSTPHEKMKEEIIKEISQPSWTLRNDLEDSTKFLEKAIKVIDVYLAKYS